MGATPGSKRKVAILGGGAAALASAFELTNRPGWEKDLEVTVYSLGWRLGGKGATGRNPRYGYRIEEHGLHMWFGFYDAAFGMMRQVYKELNRPRSHPLPDFKAAFLPQDIYSMEHQFAGQWYHWNMYMPPNDREPGTPQALGLGDYLLEGLRLLVHFVSQGTGGTGGADGWAAHDVAAKAAHPSFLTRTLNEAGQVLAAAAGAAASPVKLLQKAFELAHGLVAAGHEEHKDDCHPVLQGLVKAALKLLRVVLGKSIDTNLEAYRCWIAADMLGTIIVGALADDLISRGLDCINDRNWEDWLTAHGLSDVTLKSCLVQVGYDSSFGFFKGQFNMEAGTMLSGAIKLYLEYKGSIVYRFAAGTGDTVFAPVYECLKKRGVKFRLFTDVKEIVAENGVVTAVRFVDQAPLKGDDYDPFITVKGLACWPSTPRYEQLQDGEALKRSGANLESYWSTWKGGVPGVLKQGVDFDEVICGISVAGLPALTPTLMAANPAWRQMLEKIKTTRTQAFQVWMTPTLMQLGWPFDKAIISCNGEPVDSWADLSCTLPFEDWPLPANEQPGCVEYFCGAMIDSPDGIPDPSKTDYPAKEAALAKQAALAYLREKFERTCPNAFKDGKFRWELVVDPEPGRTGEARFDSQWWRANIDPSERYVLSTVDSTKYRLATDESGFANFYLAGDWTDNGKVNAGCMEAACLSGLQAGQAVLAAVGRGRGRSRSA